MPAQINTDLELVQLVYVDADGGEHAQPLSDLSTAGTLVDPETDQDMELIGWRLLAATREETDAGDPAPVAGPVRMSIIHDGDRLFDEQVARADMVSTIYRVAGEVVRRSGGRFEPDTDDLDVLVEHAAEHGIDVYVD